jgi:hypothetical protein
VYSAAANMAASATLPDANKSDVTRQVMAAVSDVINRNSSSGESTTVTRAERATALAVVTNALTASGDAVDHSTRQQAADVLLKVLNSTDAQNSLDVQQDGATAVKALAALANGASNANAGANGTTQTASSTLANAAEQLSLIVASTANFGVPTKLQGDNLTVSGVTRAGNDLGMANITDERSRLTLPANFTIAGADATKTYGLSSVSYQSNPVAATGLGDKGMATAVAEFNVVNAETGARVPVQNSTGIVIELVVQTTSTMNTSALVCRYYNKETSSWTTDGVVTVSYNATTQKLTCRSTHLSMFGGSESGSVGPSTPPATPTPPTPPGGSTPTPAPGTSGTPSPPGSPTTPTPSGPTPPAGPTTTAAPGSPAASDSMDGNTVGAIVGGTAAGLFVIFAAGFLIVKSRNTRSTGFVAADGEAPLTEMAGRLDDRAARPGFQQL